MRTLIVFAIAMIACISCAPVEKQESEHKITKRQIPMGFASDDLIGPYNIPVGMMGSMMGGFGLGVGGLGVGGLGVGGLGLGVGGIGLGLGSARNGDAPLEQIAVLEGFGPQGHGAMGLGYGGVGKWSGPYGPSPIPEPFGFGRPFGGVAAGALGSLDYGPFGAPLSGPFKAPQFKMERIASLFNINREVNNRQLLPGMIIRND